MFEFLPSVLRLGEDTGSPGRSCCLDEGGVFLGRIRLGEAFALLC